jgi:hypothetical protein
MFGGLRKILQGAKDQVNPFDGGKSWGNPQGKPAPQAPAKPIMPYGMKDMSTADTGIVGPTSSFPPAASMPARPNQAGAAQRYYDNPQSREFIGVDPKIFGYPADNTATAPVQYEDGSNSAGRRAGDSVDDFMPALLRTLFRR